MQPRQGNSGVRHRSLRLENEILALDFFSYRIVSLGIDHTPVFTV